MTLAEVTQQPNRWTPWPKGPAIAYISEGPDPVVTVVDRVDFEGMPGRDRAICRALLEYTLKRLNEAEEADAR